MMSIQEVWQVFTERLPQGPAQKNHSIDVWYDKHSNQIMCLTEELADMIADIIDGLAGPGDTHTSYYDPYEDAVDGIDDRYTGWWAIDYD